MQRGAQLLQPRLGRSRRRRSPHAAHGGATGQQQTRRAAALSQAPTARPAAESQASGSSQQGPPTEQCRPRRLSRDRAAVELGGSRLGAKAGRITKLGVSPRHRFRSDGRVIIGPTRTSPRSDAKGAGREGEHVGSSRAAMRAGSRISSDSRMCTSELQGSDVCDSPAEDSGEAARAPARRIPGSDASSDEHRAVM